LAGRRRTQSDIDGRNSSLHGFLRSHASLDLDLSTIVPEILAIHGITVPPAKTSGRMNL
jgi:hypothetical protein